MTSFVSNNFDEVGLWDMNEGIDMHACWNSYLKEFVSKFCGPIYKRINAESKDCKKIFANWHVGMYKTCFQEGLSALSLDSL